MANELKYLDYQGVVTFWAHIKQKLDGKLDKDALGTVYRFKGSCTSDALAAKTDQESGDVWDIIAGGTGTTYKVGMNYAWTGTAWDALGATYDLSGYLTKTEAVNTYQAKGSYKTTQTAVTNPTASGTSTTFISGISQDANGVITPTAANLPTASVSAAGIVKLGTTATTAAAGNHTHSAYVNQNAFSKVAVSGQTTVEADTTTDTLTLVAGSNVTITTNATNDSVTIAASKGTYADTAASGSAGTSGATWKNPVVYASITGAHVLSGSTSTMPAASTNADGYLSSTDWATFNGKQDTLTRISDGEIDTICGFSVTPAQS